MTKSQLVDQLKTVISAESITATVYFMMKSDDGPCFRRADVDDTIEPEIRDRFLETLKSEIAENEELNVLELSSGDDRRNAVYRYDLDDFPEGLDLKNEILDNDNLSDFSFTRDELSDIIAVVVLIGNDEHHVVIYKRNYPINLIRRDHVFALLPAETRFVKLEKDVLKINPTIDAFLIGGELFIKNTAMLERFFGFYDIIVKRAREGLNAIEQSGILDNPDSLEEFLEDVRFARKLVKVTAQSPVLGNGVPISDIISFTGTHPALRGKFRYTPDNSKIHLHTKVSKRLFLKLLNDDYLKSELTKRIYDSAAKDEVSTD